MLRIATVGLFEFGKSNSWPRYVENVVEGEFLAMKLWSNILKKTVKKRRLVRFSPSASGIANGSESENEASVVCSLSGNCDRPIDSAVLPKL